MPFIPQKPQQESLVEVGPVRVKTSTADRLRQIAERTGVGLDQAISQYLDYSVQVGLITDRKGRRKASSSTAIE